MNAREDEHFTGPSRAMAGETVYCYDPLYLEHDLPGHPEGRERLKCVLAMLSETGLLARMRSLKPRPVDPDLLARVHAPSHIAAVARLAERGGGFLDADTYVCRQSYGAAVLAAGGLVDVVGEVINGRARNGIALVRPPGHHATAERGMGFCLFNNVAIAARAALDLFGLQRVLIVDWDVHHGNGTQSIFYDSPQVLFFSTHQYPHYPGTGDWRETGAGPGRGYTVNVPLPAGVGDAGFARIFEEVLAPLAARFEPQLILVSAGYDAHWSDPLAGLHLTLTGYFKLAAAVVALAEQLCQARLVITLEGGYNLQVLAHGVANTCRALLHSPEGPSDPLGPSSWPEQPVDRILRAVKQVHNLE